MKRKTTYGRFRGSCLSCSITSFPIGMHLHANSICSHKVRARDRSGEEGTRCLTCQPFSSPLPTAGSRSTQEPDGWRHSHMRREHLITDAPSDVSRKGRRTRSHPRAKRPRLAKPLRPHPHPTMARSCARSGRSAIRGTLSDEGGGAGVWANGILAMEDEVSPTLIHDARIHPYPLGHSARQRAVTHCVRTESACGFNHPPGRGCGAGSPYFLSG